MNGTTFSVHSSPATPPRHQHVSAFDSTSDIAYYLVCVCAAGLCVCLWQFVYHNYVNKKQAVYTLVNVSALLLENLQLSVYSTTFSLS